MRTSRGESARIAGLVRLNMEALGETHLERNAGGWLQRGLVGARPEEQTSAFGRVG